MNRPCISVVLAAVIAAIAFAGGCSCGGKKSDPGIPPEVTGLAAVPANAEGVIGADVGKLSDSPIITRAIEQLLAHDGNLATSWKQVREGCKVDVVKQVRRVMLVLGPPAPGGRLGTGPALMIAVGHLPEADLSDCVTKLVGKGGGQISGKPVGTHTLYSVKDGPRAVYFAYGRPDTVILGNNEAYVIEALGPGKKALDNPELAVWLKLVDQNAPIWAVGRVDERVRKGLAGIATGLQAGPSAVFGTLDPTDGAKVSFGAVMASAADAKQLESWANNERKLVAMAAQRWSLMTVVAKLTITSQDNLVKFNAPLDMGDVNLLLSALDVKEPAKQDSPPAEPGSGSGAK